MTKKILFGVIGVALVALIVRVYAFGPSDRELIQKALDDSVAASRNGEAGGVLEHLSRSITFNGEPVSNRPELARWIRMGRPEVTIENREPVINGATASLTTPVHVKINFNVLNLDQRVDGVQITFRRKTGTMYYVFPYAEWEIASVTAPDFDPKSMAPTGGL